MHYDQPDVKRDYSEYRHGRSELPLGSEFDNLRFPRIDLFYPELASDGFITLKNFIVIKPLLEFAAQVDVWHHHGY
jgi:hypothetical protein